QKDIGGGLADGEAADRVDQIAAGREAVATGQKDPDGHDIRQYGHRFASSCSISTAWSRNRASSTTTAQATSMPMATFSSGTVPPDERVFNVPYGSRVLAKKAVPASRPASPVTR